VLIPWVSSKFIYHEIVQNMNIKNKTLLPVMVAIHLLSNDNFDKFALLSVLSSLRTSESAISSGCRPAAIPAISGPAETEPQL